MIRLPERIERRGSRIGEEKARALVKLVFVFEESDAEFWLGLIDRWWTAKQRFARMLETIDINWEEESRSETFELIGRVGYQEWY